MISRHSLLTLFLASLLAVRLASPFGFMPDVSGGRMALVECPDAVASPMAHHGAAHGEKAKLKSPCPFAAGIAPTGPLPTGWTIAIPFVWPAARTTLPPVEDFSLFVRPTPRPPSRAPPQA